VIKRESKMKTPPTLEYLQEIKAKAIAERAALKSTKSAQYRAYTNVLKELEHHIAKAKGGVA
jgi:hypothetical protein